jgi:hypothetical protein
VSLAYLLLPEVQLVPVFRAEEVLLFGEMVSHDAKHKKAREALLVGPNWEVRGPEFEMKDLQGKLGGTPK